MRSISLLSAAAALLNLQAGSNIDPGHALISHPLLGGLHWRPSDSSGASVSQFYCTGFVYGPSIGWISLSSGVPANRLAFGNNSAADYGVNVSPAGELSGFAYGANIGWINFAPGGEPKIDFSTGNLSGAAWAANAGWISLATADQYIRVESMPVLPDSDNDDLPDAWEIQFARGLGILSGTEDADKDGQTNLQEYLSGTDPLDAGDVLGLTLHVTTSGRNVQFPTKAGHTYRLEQHGALGSGSWTAVSISNVPGTGAPATVQLPADSSNIYFYRVAAYLPFAQVP